jgi:glutathione synthase/RimK-type ligase-like ATP-grasp enzyme
MKIALLYNKSGKIHSTSWHFVWEEYCKSNKLEYSIFDSSSMNLMQKLMSFDVILWHYSNYSAVDMMIARNILNTLELNGKSVFPSIRDAWHFDDKIAETYLMESIKAPIARSFYYYNLDKLIAELDEVSFPVVAKLRKGSGSNGVKLIRDKSELRNYAEKMFSVGFDITPSLAFKTLSNLRSVRNFGMFVNRFKRINEFLRTRSAAKMFNKEIGYCYFQEFIPNDGFDLKIVIVGDKLSFVGRYIREGDFRASGGGAVFYDRSKITENIIESAFSISEKLGFNCMGFDFIIDSGTNIGKVVEISYGFNHMAIIEANGYFDRDGVWYDEPLNVPLELIAKMLK